MTTTNAATTRAFFAATDKRTQTDILAAIAEDYGITPAEALEEVTDPEAHHLLDYIAGPMRAAAHVLMKRHGLA